MKLELKHESKDSIEIDTVKNDKKVSTGYNNVKEKSARIFKKNVKTSEQLLVCIRNNNRKGNILIMDKDNYLNNIRTSIQNDLSIYERELQEAEEKYKHIFEDAIMNVKNSVICEVKKVKKHYKLKDIINVKDLLRGKYESN